MWGNWTFAKKLAAGYGLAVLTLLIIATVSYRTTVNFFENDELVSHSHQVRAGLADLLSDLINAETGTRGYAITGNDSYLDPYKSALGEVKVHFDEVQQLTADNPNQQRRLVKIQ